MIYELGVRREDTWNFLKRILNNSYSFITLSVIVVSSDDNSREEVQGSDT